MRRRAVLLSIGLVCAAGISLSVILAHGGGLDRCGGHNDRKHGGYHVHNWTTYCGCHPEAAECASKKGAVTPNAVTLPSAVASTPSTDSVADLRARVEKLEARVGALERAVSNQ